MSFTHGPWSTPLIIKCICALFESKVVGTKIIPIREEMSVGKISELLGFNIFFGTGPRDVFIIMPFPRIGLV